MAINERLIDTEVAAAAPVGNAGEEGLILHLDANDVDSYDGDGDVWYDISDHEFTPAVDPAENFNTVTYTGNGSTKAITGLGFQPDLVWIKLRNTSGHHSIMDSLRGASSILGSSYTNAASSQDASWRSTYGELDSFDSDGFTVSDGTNSTSNFNSNHNYVAWCFKAGGAPTATNTSQSTQAANSISIDGVLQEAGYTHANGVDNYPYKASVNTKLGFSVCYWEADGLSKDRIPHFLGEKPEMIIMKRTSDTSAWTIWHKALSSDSHRLTFTTSSQANAPTIIEDITSGYFEIGSGIYGVQEDWVSYAFASKRGVSKVGSYTGGSTGEIYTGFEPAWVMVKRTNASGDDWHIFDSVRGGGSKFDEFLKANTSDDEGSASNREITFTGSGFKWTNTTSNAVNTSGNTYIYLAFAKSTNETSLIDDTDLELHLDADSFPQKGESGYSNTPTTWEDKTSNNYDGTISGAVFDSELGNWLDLDGIDDKIDITGTSTLLDGDFTVEMWWNFDSISSSSGYQMLFSGSDYNASAGSLGHYIEDKTIRTWITNASSTSVNVATSGDILSQNKWYHIVLTREGGTYRHYLDGELKTTATGQYSGSLSSSNSRIGNDYVTGYPVDGKVGQVRIYGTALTQAQIRQNFNFTKNDYPNGVNMDNVSGGATFDTSTHTSPDVDVFSLDGSNDYFDSSTFVSSLGSISYTLSAWIYVQGALSGGGGYAIMGTYASSAGMWLDVIKSSGKLRLYHTGGTTVNQQSTGTVSQNTWHHVICVRDRVNGKVNFFIDGVAAGSTSIASANGSANGSGFEVGRYDDGYYFNGDIAQVKVYDKALSTTECQALFNQNATTFGKTEV